MRRIFSKKGLMMLVLVILIGVLMPLTAFAADDAAKTTQDVMQAMITAVNIGISLMQMILWPLLWLAGKLLTNDLIFGNNVEEHLRGIWQQVRNLVNLGFVVILLVIAFSNILGLGQENKYAIKKALPKFVAALLLVNFSFFGVKVVLDVSNILTTSFIGISGQKITDMAKWPAPKISITEKYNFHSDSSTKVTDQTVDSVTLSGNNAMRATAEIQICSSVKDEETGKMKTLGKDLFCETETSSGVQIFTGFFNDKAMSFLKSMDARNITLYMATNLININAVDKLPNMASGTSSDATSTIAAYLEQMGNLVVGTLFSIINLFVFGTAIISLVIVLFIRVIVMWNVLVLSPLFALMIFLPESVKSGLDVQKQVVKQAIAPVIIAATMGIGLTILYGLNGSVVTELSDMTIQSALFESLSDIAVMIGVVVVVWKGVETASKDTFGGFIVESVQKNVMGIGKLAGEVAKAIPIAQVETTPGHKEAVSLGVLPKTIERITGSIQGAVGDQAGRLAEGPSKAIKGFLHLSTGPNFSDELAKLNSTITAGIDTASRNWQQPMRDTVGASSKENLNGTQFRENLAKIIQEAHLEGIVNPADVRDPNKIKDIENLINEKPELQEALFGKKQTVQEVRTEYKKKQEETGVTAPPPPTPKLPTSVIGDALKSGKTDEEVVATLEADPETKKRGLGVAEVKGLRTLNDRILQEQIVDLATDASTGVVDKNKLGALIKAATDVRKGDVAALTQALNDKKITPAEARTIVSKAQLDDKKEKPLLDAITGVEQAAAPPGSQPPPGPPGGSPGAAGGPPPAPPTPSPPGP